MSTTDNRAKLDSILLNMKAMDSQGVKVGVFEGLQHKDTQGGRVRFTSMAMLAAVHEYGSPKRKIPERSYLRSWSIWKQQEIQNTMAKLTEMVQDGRLTADAALKRLGVYAKSGVKAQILALVSPALKPATIKAKGSSKLLVDSSQFLNSIQSKSVNLSDVEDGGGS